MDFVYVDETGTDQERPLVVMVGIVVNDERLRRTQEELAAVLTGIGGIPAGTLRELKGRTLINGSGVWGTVDGDKRWNVAKQLCRWIRDRRHDLALAAISKESLVSHHPPVSQLANIWQACAFHVALQMQRVEHQKARQGKRNKHRAVLVFDDNKKEATNLSDLVADPPKWTADYCEIARGKPPLDLLVDTPFAVKSHHVALVQVADVFAWLLRRFAELKDFSKEEKYVGELAHYQECVDTLAPLLVPRSHRWPVRTTSECARWYRELAPASLMALK